jgi:hypothetical protein
MYPNSQNKSDVELLSGKEQISLIHPEITKVVLKLVQQIPWQHFEVKLNSSDSFKASCRVHYDKNFGKFTSKRMNDVVLKIGT